MSDPYHEFYSPYVGMGNNPVSNIDPDGGCTKCPKGAKAGDTFNHSEAGTLTYKEFKNGGEWLTSGGNIYMDDVKVSPIVGGPGAIFRSPDRAAINFAKLYNDNSILDKKEYGARIYRVDLKSGNNYFTYGTPNISNAENGVIPKPDFSIKNGSFIGTVHTHSNYSKRYMNDRFSEDDIFWADLGGYIGASNIYLATPSGEVLKYDVNTLMTTRIHKSVPSDSIHRHRVNLLNSENFPKNEPTR